ncbi:MAG: DUF3137 domain-containing protein [Pseudomonadota bacterium]
MARPGRGRAHALEDLEFARLGLLRKAKIWGGVVLGMALLQLAFGVSLLSASITLVLGALVIYVATRFFFGAIRVGFKQAVMPSLAEKVAPGLSYLADGAIEVHEFKQSGLFEDPDRYTGTDLFEGRVGQTQIRFGLLEAEEEYTVSSTDSNGDRQEDDKFRSIFTGMFFVADGQRTLAGKTLVCPASSGLLSLFAGPGADLQDPAFSKMFKVTSDSDLEARRALTPSMIERFKALHAKVGGFHASFHRGRVYIAVPMSLDTFKPKMLTPLTDPVQIEEAQAALTSIVAIVADLGLG